MTSRAYISVSMLLDRSAEAPSPSPSPLPLYSSPLPLPPSIPVQLTPPPTPCTLSHHLLCCCQVYSVSNLKRALAALDRKLMGDDKETTLKEVPLTPLPAPAKPLLVKSLRCWGNAVRRSKLARR